MTSLRISADNGAAFPGLEFGRGATLTRPGAALASRACALRTPALGLDADAGGGGEAFQLLEA